MEIARKLNIRHPWKNDFPFVMTTDFLITRNDGLHARTVKGSDELDNPRVIEKFSIEHAYWSSKGVDWKIVTEKQINRDKALNIQWLYSGELPEEVIPEPDIRKNAMEALLGIIDQGGLLPANRIAPFEEAFRLRPGSAVSLYKSLIINGSISPDLNRKIFC